MPGRLLRAAGSQLCAALGMRTQELQASPLMQMFAPRLLQLVLRPSPCCKARSAVRISPSTWAASWPSGTDGTLISLRFVGSEQKRGDAARLHTCRTASPAWCCCPCDAQHTGGLTRYEPVSAADTSSLSTQSAMQQCTCSPGPSTGHSWCSTCGNQAGEQSKPTQRRAPGRDSQVHTAIG